MRLNLYYTTLSLLAYSVAAVKLENQMHSHSHDLDDYICGANGSESGGKSKCDNLWQDLAKLTRKMEHELGGGDGDSESSSSGCMPLEKLKKQCASMHHGGPAAAPAGGKKSKESAEEGDDSDSKKTALGGADKKDSGAKAPKA